MSSFLSRNDDGTYKKEIESIDICKWKINEICCNAIVNIVQIIHTQLANVKVRNNVNILKKKMVNKAES